MPTRIRPPDLLARPGQDALPAASTLGKPPPGADGIAGADGTGDATGTGDAVGSLGAAEEPPWAGLRLVTVPDGWPPYDCDTHGAACPAAAPGDGGTVMPAGKAAPVAGAALARADIGAAGVAPPGEGADAGAPGKAIPHREAASRGAAEPRLAAAWPGQFGQVLVEILAGFRPAKQLASWTTERVRAQIDLLSCAVATEQRPRIRRVMTSRPRADVVEMTMVVGFGPRSRALAIRFERIPARPQVPGRPARPARWLCTEIETS